MSGFRKRIKYSIFAGLFLLLTLAVFMPAIFLSGGQEARALSPDQWEIVRKAMDGYLTSQFKPEAEGEAGFVLTQADLKTRLDSNKNGKVLDEGDDAALAPVLLDVLEGSTGIPGTAVKSTWNTTSLADATVQGVKKKVDAHAEAGFSTDVAAYCATGHTESPVTGGYGAIAHAGGLSSDTAIIPKVYALKWGRQGWTNGTPPSYGNANPLGAAGAPTKYTKATTSQCASSTTDAETVRCMAAWAISESGGKVSNGINPPLTGLQAIDIRVPGPSQTVSNSPATIQIPIDKLFNTGLENLNSANPQKIFIGRTQHVEGIAAIGAEMLGYDSIFLKWGMPNYNNTQQEKAVASGPDMGSSYALVSNYVDAAVPKISNTAVFPGETSIRLTWQTDEPATSIVAYSKTKGGPYDKAAVTDAKCDSGGTGENCTVLRASHSVNLTNLETNTDYYCQVTSYDGSANKVVSAEIPCGTTFTDKTPPAISGVTGDDNTITASFEDPEPSSQINTASLAVYVDNKLINECWSDGSPKGTVSCATPAGLSGNSHTVSVKLTDLAGNIGAAEGTANITGLRDLLASLDSTPPITSAKPTTWQNKQFYFILPCSDGAPFTGSGCKETWYTLEDPTNPNAKWTKANVTAFSADGIHDIAYYSIDNKGNKEAFIKDKARLDTKSPQIKKIMPAQDGQIEDNSTEIIAAYGDSLSGVNPDTLKVAVDGEVKTCTKDASFASCPVANLSRGKHSINVEIADFAGNVTGTSTEFYVTRQYNWTWYDDRYMRDWVLTANPEINTEDAMFNLKFGPYTINKWSVSPGKTVANMYPGMMTGPVKVTSEYGYQAIVSQRMLMGNSFEEVLGSETTRLSDHFYWTWYDQKSSGFKNWVLISNPSTSTVHAVVSFVNKQDGIRVNAGRDIPPGASWTPTFPGKMGGPVEVIATGGKVMASQRVVSGNGAAFNEVPGIPAEELSDTYNWTWYDQKSPASRNWILIANPASAAAPIYYELTMDGKELARGGPINPGENVTPVFAGKIGGPVILKTFSDSGHQQLAKSIASQRVVWGPSFEEVPGYPRELLGSDYYWTWYDMKSAGVSNWILIANPGQTPVSYTIKIGGKIPKGGTGDIPAHGKVTPVFRGTMNGPVEVSANGGDVIVSQRVLWNGFFNEVQGTQLN